MRAAGLHDRVAAEQQDMSRLQYEPASFDLVWAEGSAYIMGIARALAAWRPLLKPGGYLGFTDLVWLTSAPPAEAAEFFADEYPAMTTAETVAELVAENGYQLVEQFTLPDMAWWDDYYTPLSAKIPGLLEKYADDETGQSVVLATEREVAVRKDFGSSYGYEFFVARLLR